MKNDHLMNWHEPMATLGRPIRVLAAEVAALAPPAEDTEKSALTVDSMACATDGDCQGLFNRYPGASAAPVVLVVDLADLDSDRTVVSLGGVLCAGTDGMTWASIKPPAGWRDVVAEYHTAREAAACEAEAMREADARIKAANAEWRAVGGWSGNTSAVARRALHDDRNKAMRVMLDAQPLSAAVRRAQDDERRHEAEPLDTRLAVLWRQERARRGLTG